MDHQNRTTIDGAAFEAIVKNGAVGPGTLILGFCGDPAIRHLNK